MHFVLSKTGYAVMASVLFAILCPAPKVPPFPLENEVPITPYKLQQDNYIVIVPEGFEEQAAKRMSDLKHCQKAVPEFTGVSPLWNGFIWKVYLKSSGDGGSWYFKGVVYTAYDPSENNINEDSVVINASTDDGHCAAAHEFTHYVLDRRPIPLWAEEGLAEMASDSLDPDGHAAWPICTEDGIKETNPNKPSFYKYEDLSKMYTDDNGGLWYQTAECFWIFFDVTFGAEKRHEVFQKLKKDWTDLEQNTLTGADKDAIFASALIEVAGEEVIELGSHFGLDF